jgi:hypothetical protein
MQISKQRLIQIIKEELQSEDMAGMPLYGDGDRGIDAPPAQRSLDNLRAQIGAVLSRLDHNSAVDVMMGVATDLGLNPPEEEEAPSEYGAETGMGFVKTREDLERMIGDELVALLGETIK